MSRRDWFSLIALAGGLALAVAANAQGINHNTGSTQGTQQSSPKPATHAPPSDLTAIKGGVERIASALETANGKKKSAAETQYEASYLKTQKNMARWGKYMLLVAGFEALITALGVFLVWRTLIAARTSAAEAGKAAKQAERQANIAQKMFENLETPHVYPSNLVYFVEGGNTHQHASGRRSYVFTVSTGGPCVAVNAKNYGRAPARMKSAKLRFTVTSDWTKAAIFVTEKTFHFNYMLGEKDSSDPFKIGPMPNAVQYMTDIDNGSKFLLIDVYLRYEDVFRQFNANGTSFYWEPKTQSFAYGHPGQSEAESEAGETA